MESSRRNYFLWETAIIENVQQKAEDNPGECFTGRIQGKQARLYDRDAEKACTVQVIK